MRRIYVTSDSDFCLLMTEIEFKDYKQEHPEAEIVGTE